MTKNLSPGGHKDDKYFLISPFIDFRCQLELTHIEFQKLSASHATIKNNIIFEENLLQVFYSMAEFESFILESSLRHSLFPISDFEFAQDNRIRGNIKVASFLNSVTSFKDQFPKFDHLSPGVDLKDVFTTLWTNCRNKSVDFSFFERLRNFSQHQTQPVSSYTIGSNWNEELSLHEHRASLFASVEEVSRNRSIKNEERERYFKNSVIRRTLDLFSEKHWGVL
ncbi:hypothetical protein [Rhizobium sp. YS-1r]|uniref:hypothetical protein n=1 Tax=Rhizobium sp. YS-1r TaxID=1532558 RepID=UPI00126A653D|nr:hypothetical protein [Rhizobium sp. YS-1r]